MALLRSREAESFTVTTAPEPLKERLFPNLPEVVQVAPLIVPVFPFPDISPTDVPEPSLKEYAATRPAMGALTESTNEALLLYWPSFTVTVIVAAPVCPVTGVTVTVRLLPLPPSTMLLGG